MACNNGRYADKNFLEQVDKHEQKITFYGVGVHHQNGISESAVKIHTLRARTLLLHAKRYWPTVISTMLWPYNLLAFVEFHNLWGIGEDNKTPMMRLLRLKECPDLKMEYTFG